MDLAQPREGRAQHAAETVEIEAHADVLESHLGAADPGTLADRVHAHRAHPTSFASRAWSLTYTGRLTASTTAAAANGTRSSQACGDWP